MQPLQTQICQWPRTPLLQHLASIPTQQLEQYTLLYIHFLLLMIIILNWFGCSSNAAWETQIRHSLQSLSDIKPIPRARLRVEEDVSSNVPFHLTLMLSMPGPDVLVHARGHSFENALEQLISGASAKLSAQAQKS